MKKLLLICACVFLVACSGSRPTDIGFINDRFLACPDKPNCVSSFEAIEDETHYIAPIETSNAQTAKAKITSILESTEGVVIVKSEGNYLYAEYTSSLMKFVDDVEFYIDAENKLIHVRSASRLGYSDLGVNRERIESIRIQID